MDSARRFQLWVHEASLTCDSLASPRLMLISASYKPPSRIKIAGPLLEKAYSKMKDKVDEYLDSLSELNVITDESSNTNKARICQHIYSSPPWFDSLAF